MIKGGANLMNPLPVTNSMTPLRTHSIAISSQRSTNPHLGYALDSRTPKI